MVTVGGFLTEIVTGAERAFDPRTSVASAVRTQVFVRFSTGFQNTWKFELVLVTVPSTLVPAKNRTQLIGPFGLEAVAVTMRFVPATKDWPSSG